MSPFLFSNNFKEANGESAEHANDSHHIDQHIEGLKMNSDANANANNNEPNDSIAGDADCDASHNHVLEKTQGLVMSSLSVQTRL